MCPHPLPSQTPVQATTEQPTKLHVRTNPPKKHKSQCALTLFLLKHLCRLQPNNRQSCTYEPTPLKNTSNNVASPSSFSNSCTDYNRTTDKAARTYHHPLNNTSNNVPSPSCFSNTCTDYSRQSCTYKPTPLKNTSNNVP